MLNELSSMEDDWFMMAKNVFMLIRNVLKVTEPGLNLFGG